MISTAYHARQYYTLADIPQFDADGLWLYADVGFSQHGTLKDTVPALVDRSQAGLFHRDLQVRLQVRVHNTLLDLVQTKRLARETIASEYVYVSGNSARAKAQLARRRECSPVPAICPASPAPILVIEILLEVIHAAGVRGDPAAIAARLTARGVVVRVEQIDAVFQQHGLPQKKTTAR